MTGRYACLRCWGVDYPGMRELLADRRTDGCRVGVYGVIAAGPLVGGIDLLGYANWRDGGVELEDIEPAWPAGEDADGGDEIDPHLAVARSAVVEGVSRDRRD